MSLRILRSALFCALICFLPVYSVSAQQQRNIRQYALVLDEPAVGERFATREALHSIEAENYRGKLQNRQADLKRELALRKFAVVGAVDTLSNAIFVATTPDRADKLKTLPGVKGVVEMRMLKPRLNAATTLANEPVAWTALGGQTNAGKGIMVGVIGSGIDQTHPAFQDPSLPMPAGFPKCTNNYPADCNYTNNKVIVARSYVRELSVGSSNDPTAVANDSGPDDYSPRDRSGHGTAIASVIAGSQTTSPAVPFSGMAPKAWLGNYRVENSPGMPGGVGGNFESVYIEALNDTFNDGMQIVNLSSGTIALYGPLDTGSVCGQAAGVPCDFLAYNFEKAAQLGMLITRRGGRRWREWVRIFQQRADRLQPDQLTGHGSLGDRGGGHDELARLRAQRQRGGRAIDGPEHRSADQRRVLGRYCRRIVRGRLDLPGSGCGQGGERWVCLRRASGVRPLQCDRLDSARELQLQHQGHQRGQGGGAGHHLLHEYGAADHRDGKPPRRYRR